MGEDGVGWAVVPEPPFLSRPSSSFSSSFFFFLFFFGNSRTNFFFSSLSREQWGGRWVCRRLLCQGADLCCRDISGAGGCD